MPTELEGDITSETAPTFIMVRAPLQQDEELQVISICKEALKRLSTSEARLRVLDYLTKRESF